jgi:hypothetical protein
MKRRLFALLAVPALTLGFAFASPATDRAEAYYGISPGFGLSVACAAADFYYAQAVDAGDETTAEQIYAMTKDWPC